MEALVSIIIPSFNRAHLIGDTLDTIIQQTYTNWECLVVDDGSTDNLKSRVSEYCKRDERIQFFDRPSNRPKGANSCRNYGLKLSKGKYVNFYDSDDLMHPEKLQLQVEALEKSDKSFCVCQTYVFEKNVKAIIGIKSEEIISDQIFDDFLQKRIVIPILAPVFKKSFLIEGNFYFDEYLQAGQEWHLFTRILFYNQDYSVINLPLDYIRQHKNSISGDLTQQQLWYYFLARFKIYKQFKKRLSKENIVYLKRYFLLLFKLLLRQKFYVKAYKVWKMALVTDKTYSYKQQIQLLFSLLSYTVFKKGDIFLSKVNRWNN